MYIVFVEGFMYIFICVYIYLYEYIIKPSAKNIQLAVIYACVHIECFIPLNPVQ